MTESFGTHGVDATADPLMRRLIHAVDHLRAEAERATKANIELREQLKARLTRLEQDARREAEGFTTSHLGTELREAVEAAAQSRAPTRSTQAVPLSLSEAGLEWKQLSEQAYLAKQDLVAQFARWNAKTFKTSRNKPTVPDQFWEATARLDEIHRAAPALRDGFVSHAIASHAHLNADLSRDSRARADALAEVFTDGRVLIERIASNLELPGAGWADPRWQAAEPAETLGRYIRLGEFRPSLPSVAGEITIPALIDFPFQHGIALQAGVQGRDSAIALARAIMLRLLAAVPPGRVNFVVVDPLSLGRTVADFRHLAEFDERLVDAKTWTSERDIERRLDELASHLEVVISKHLRGQFESIDVYNQYAGEVAEPYRVLVVFDYPHGFGERSARQLLSLIENGPRCGVHTILLCDPDSADPPTSIERLAHSMQGVHWSATGQPVATLPPPIGSVRMDFVPDIAPAAEFAVDGQPTNSSARLLTAVGEAARQTQSGPVTLERVLPILNRMIAAGRSADAPQVTDGAPTITADDPASWWSATTAAGATAVIGRSGAQDVAALHFSSTEVAGGAIMVGLPRSGKSTALHAAITSLALLYPPEELELYLVDSKHGVEFQVYAALPHARLVSVHSEREFAVAVLKSLVHEISRRADLMKSHGGGVANITDYRAATGVQLSRVVLVMDEFHEVFEDNDALGQAAFDTFSDIVRQGPFAGVHIVLSSQTLSGMPAMDRQTLDLLPMRIAFMCNELDADYVMGESQKEARALNTQGEGVFNPLRGTSGRTKRFKGLYIPSDQRNRLLHDIVAKAKATGVYRVPRVFDGESLAAVPSLPRDEPVRPQVAIGEPFDLNDFVGLTLRRRRGTNVLLVGGDDDTAVDHALHGAMHSFLRAAKANGLTSEVVDLLDDGVLGRDAVDLRELCEMTGNRYSRSAELEEALARSVDLADQRHQSSRFDEPAHLLLINGLQRAFDMAPYEPDALRFDSDDDLDAPAAPTSGQRLYALATTGPDVGVHTVVLIDSLAQFERRCGRELLAEFELRIAGASTRPGDVGLLAETHADVKLMRNQLALLDRARSSDRRVRGYPLERRPTGMDERNVDGI
jgi:DNA segregation ATPase FtsK/SpoIIIE, S-DNA-T family